MADFKPLKNCKSLKKIIICLDPDAWDDQEKLYHKLNIGKLMGKVWSIKLEGNSDIADLQGKIENYKEKIDNKKMAPVVAKALDVLKPELIVDCRSSTYKTVWQSPVDKTVEIHVSTVVDGVRKVVTHMSKKTRGEIARLLLQARSMPNSPEDLYAIVSETYPCALTPPTDNEPWILEVIAV